MPSSVSLECSTATMNSGIPQNAVSNDKPTRKFELDPFSPEELAGRMYETQGQMWAGSPS